MITPFEQLTNTELMTVKVTYKSGSDLSFYVRKDILLVQFIAQTQRRFASGALDEIVSIDFQP